jgi:hypothetical protein
MVFGFMPLVVGIPYAAAWILRPTQFLNVTIGYPYAGVSLLCFFLALALGVIAAFRGHLLKRGMLSLVVILACDLLLGGWLLLIGPGQSISVSEVTVVNNLTEEISLVEVESPYYKTTLRRIPAGMRRAVPVMPKSEGRLEIKVHMPGGNTLSQHVFIMEAFAEEFVFEVSPCGLTSIRNE